MVRTAIGGALLVAVVTATPTYAQTPLPPQKPAAATPSVPAPADSAQPAAPAAGTGQRFGSWILSCPPEGASPKANCVLVQQFSETLSRKVVFVWLIQYDEKGQLLGAFHLPSGVFVNRGLIIKTDAKDAGLRVDYTSCDPDECQAIFSITADLAKQLSTAKTVTVDIALTNGNAATVQLGMDGFATAIAALAARGQASQQ